MTPNIHVFASNAKGIELSSVDQGTRHQQRRGLCPHVAFNWIQLCLNILQMYQHVEILMYINMFQLYPNLHYSILHSYLKLHKHIPVVSKFHLKWIRDDPWPDFNSCLALSPLRYLLWMFSKTSLLSNHSHDSQKSKLFPLWSRIAWVTELLPFGVKFSIISNSCFLRRLFCLESKSQYCQHFLWVLTNKEVTFQSQNQILPLILKGELFAK